MNHEQIISLALTAIDTIVKIVKMAGVDEKELAKYQTEINNEINRILSTEVSDTLRENEIVGGK